ncbi:hypothetical protein J2Z31_002109 [Sinorhizobium kostiense]|uniref:Flagellar FliJ protein n=1 Tax=Sinorhizobium kostiense TaxID=76747 RepID=A0ABS4QY94_9HYPH|nr:hypothetical protein [Sinorhizobium kostiense]MBP2235617.1 hypothetical protein [Sinorhizobium kostiense]
MKTRSEKLKRLVAVQRHLERIAESELAEIASQRGLLSETITSVVDAMGSAHPLHRMFSGYYGSQLGRLVQKDQMLLGIQEVHEARIAKERAKGDRLEESMMDARLMEEREAADAQILDLIDQYVAGHAPASGKVERR